MVEAEPGRHPRRAARGRRWPAPCRRSVGLLSTARTVSRSAGLSARGCGLALPRRPCRLRGLAVPAVVVGLRPTGRPARRPHRPAGSTRRSRRRSWCGLAPAALAVGREFAQQRGEFSLDIDDLPGLVQLGLRRSSRARSRAFSRSRVRRRPPRRPRQRLLAPWSRCYATPRSARCTGLPGAAARPCQPCRALVLGQDPRLYAAEYRRAPPAPPGQDRSPAQHGRARPTDVVIAFPIRGSPVSPSQAQ